jgi:tetratricopeptide (TPR) repeat protein
MSKWWPILQGVFMLLVFLGVALWFLFWRLKKSEDPAQLLFKWIVTVGLVVSLLWSTYSLGSGGGLGQIAGVLAGAVHGLLLAIIWARTVGETVGNWFGNLYDGGNVPPVPEPHYSTAIARRKQGHYREAIQEIRQQLALFPHDAAGQMMIAEIQAENLNDLPGAQVTVERLCAQPGQHSRTIAYALTTLAEWQLKILQDVDGAREYFEQIIRRFPDSPEAQAAAQRIARLSTTEQLLAAQQPRTLQVKSGPQDLGLQQGPPGQPHRELTPEEQSAQLVQHLDQHPLDTEAREELARLYADHYARLDLAAGQLEQLIQAPNQPQKKIVHWLNLLADFQVKYGHDLALAQQALQRIIDLHPASAAAEQAQSRLACLKREFKHSEKEQTLRLPTYEHDLGLKHHAATPPARDLPPPKRPAD